jgi:tetratricopeptide (TPR) repeat protein
VGNTKLALEILKLNVLAYPESADANDSLGDAYLANGEKDLARQYAEKALALLASDTKESGARRDVIRDSAQQKLNDPRQADTLGRLRVQRKRPSKKRMRL